MSLDPTWAQRRMKEGLRKQNVIGYVNKDGTANVTGQNLDPARAAAACGRVDALAASSKNAGNPRPISHIRADLFIALLDGTYEGLTDAQILQLLAAELSPATKDKPEDEAQTPESPAPAEPVVPARPMGSPHIAVQLRIRLTTLLGLDRVPAELPGWTPIPHTHGTDLAALMGAAQWRYTLTDDDGHFLGCGLITARPYGYDRRAARNEGIVDILVPASLLREVVIDPTKGAHLIDPQILAKWMPVLDQLTDLMRNPKPLPDDSDKRFPGRGLRRKVQLRKPRCIGVGCGRASRVSEIDHRLDWVLGGRTREINLDPECGRYLPTSGSSIPTRTTISPTRPGRNPGSGPPANPDRTRLRHPNHRRGQASSTNHPSRPRRPGAWHQPCAPSARPGSGFDGLRARRGTAGARRA